ncbi:non-ribosomal peptide synthetase [Catenulispora rubra]|uniref:non-ribosomal peptide synthetase n=1 Tax=Catenulispora rubra TaxID=280293 RepID=UPI0018921DEC|nr:AMP-binding protein [Catenulispora rubra]
MRSFEASSAHKGLWLAQKLSADALNHALTMWDVEGDLDPTVMESAFRQVLNEAEVLRVTFADDGSGLRMVPRELGDWQPFFLDVADAADPQQAARDALAEMIRQPFDLERDLLFRLGVVKLAPARSLVVIAYHHLISDGFGAAGLLSHRLAEVYTALARGSAVPEPQHAWDAGSFAAIATEYHASRRFTDDKTFWRDYLKAAPAPARVPRIALSEAEQTALSVPIDDADRWSELAGAIGVVSRTLTVPRAEADAWREAAKSMGVWLSSMVTAAAAVYFRQRCDLPEFLLSLAVGNRSGAAGRTPGLAVNVVPVRVEVPLSATFAEVAEAVGDQTFDIFDHTACHYSEIQQAAGTAPADRASFGAVMNIIEFADRLDFAGCPARAFGGINGVFNELSFSVGTDGSPDSDLYFRLDAPEGLYSRAELRVIGTELIAVIRALTKADPGLPVGALDVLDGAERDRVLTAPNDTAVPLPELTVPELFALQAQRTPETDALVSWASAVSYRELDARSTRLAGALRSRGVGPETLVAVALPRSVDLAVALLGVLKAGGAYLPIDPERPVEAVKPVVGDCPVHALLTDAATADGLAPELGVPAIVLGQVLSQDSDATGDGDGVGDDGPQASASQHPDNLMAVLYGRGSPGGTAAVAMTHRNMQRLVLDRRWQEGGEAAVLWHSPHTFDALALELWTPLLTGGRVVVAPPGALDPDDLAEDRTPDDVSSLWLSAGQFCAIAADRPERLVGVREVWTGADRVPAAAVRRVRTACPDLTIVTGHGPTEAAVLAASYRVAADAAVPTGMIGGPVDNTAVYVLGPGLAPVPVGVTGELYVAGPGVARGYPGRSAHTAERFVPCPFGTPGARMYRTGDRVRWVADGEGPARLEYVGRAGARVEVRGHAVEVAEVEETLAEHAGLAHALVAGVRDPSGRQCLAAYVVPAAGKAGAAGASTGEGARGGEGEGARRDADHTGPSSEELRRFAAERLPEYLVPSVFVVLDALPLTAGGRVDRASLPEPEFGGPGYRAPRNDTERILAEVFAEALDVERVGIDEDFFDLGGNSLRAIRLVGLVRSELNQELSIRTLFAVRTITGLSEMWTSLAQSSRPALRRRTKDGEVL